MPNGRDAFRPHGRAIGRIGTRRASGARSAGTGHPRAGTIRRTLARSDAFRRGMVCVHVGYPAYEVGGGKMSVHTNADRNRASRYRKMAGGRHGLRAPTDAERAWLAQYEASRDPKHMTPPQRHAAPYQAPPPASPPTVEAPTSPGPSMVPAPGPAAPRTPDPHAAPPDWTVIDFGTPEGPRQTSLCSIPDCPACRAATGPATCGVTGRRVWPPMSEAGAEGLARILLGLIGVVARVVRKEPVPPPTDRDVKQVARALREVALRRASWVGAFDDLIALGAGVTMYTRRALTEKASDAPAG